MSRMPFCRLEVQLGGDFVTTCLLVALHSSRGASGIFQEHIDIFFLGGTEEGYFFLGVDPLMLSWAWVGAPCNLRNLQFLDCAGGWGHSQVLGEGVGFVEGRIYRCGSARSVLTRSCEEGTRGNEMPGSGARRRKERRGRSHYSGTGDLELEVLLFALLLFFCLLDLFSSSVSSRATIAASSISSSSSLVPFSSLLWLGRRRGRRGLVLKLLFEGGVTSLSLDRADLLRLGLPSTESLSPLVAWTLFPS